MRFFEHKNILIISPEAWGTSYLSKHFYARALARMGNRVFFLQPSGFGDVEQPLDKSDKGYGNLKVVQDVVVRGFRLLPAKLQKWWMLNRMHKLEQHCGCEFDVIWSFDNSRYFFLNLWNKFTIHHVVDSHMNYHLREAASSATMCLGVTHGIVDELKKYNERSYFVQHAWDPPILTNASSNTSGRTLRVGYMGNLLMQTFDANLLFEVVQSLRDVRFVLVGPYQKGHLNRTPDPHRVQRLDDLRECTNVQFAGELSPEHAFGMLQECDILILLYFNAESVVDNSSKLMSYLATGKVIVSNEIAEFNKSPLMRQAATRSEWILTLDDTIQNLAHWNSAEKMQERIDFARRNTYEIRISEIEALSQNQSKR